MSASHKKTKQNSAYELLDYNLCYRAVLCIHYPLEVRFTLKKKFVGFCFLVFLDKGTHCKFPGSTPLFSTACFRSTLPNKRGRSYQVAESRS